MKCIHCSMVLLLIASSANAIAGDCPTWGGDGSRNMVSAEKGLPASAVIPKIKDGAGPVDLAGAKNVKWAAKLGTQSYGNPTVASGKVFVGTNNDNPRDPAHTGDAGVLMCFNEADGKFLWQLIVPKLSGGKYVDWDQTGLCCPPTVDGDRVYIVTNRCEVVCLSAAGLAAGNQGPFKDEAQYIAGPGKPPATLTPTDADIIWRFDMRDELGVNPFNMTSSAILLAGQRLYVCTSNAVDFTEKHIPAPLAPALICLDKNTGKLLGRERSGISARTFHSNWSSPAMGRVNGKDLIIFGGGDGICYAYDAEPSAPAEDGIGTLKEIWRCDCNPAAYRQEKYNKPKGPSEIIATPVFHDNRVYVAIGQTPEREEGAGCLTCIDATQTGDITATGRLWTFQKLGHSISTAALADGLLYIADYAGIVYCLNAADGSVNWTHDTEARIWASPLLADGKVYVGNESNTLFVFAHGKEKKLIGQIAFESQVLSTAVAANGALFVMSDKTLFALKEGGR